MIAVFIRYAEPTGIFLFAAVVWLPYMLWWFRREGPWWRVAAGIICVIVGGVAGNLWGVGGVIAPASLVGVALWVYLMGQVLTSYSAIVGGVLLADGVTDLKIAPGTAKG